MSTPIFEANRFSNLVGQIYDCVAEPSRWVDVLSELTQEFDGVIATLAVLDVKNRSTRFGSAYGEPSIVEPLVTRYAADMPFYHLVPKAPIDVPITIAQLCAMHGPDGVDVFHASRLWTEWFIPNRIVDAMCTNIINANDRIAAFVINVSEDRPSISQSDIDKLSLITPHIRRAISIGDLFELHQRTSGMFRATLDDMHTGVLIVGHDLELHYANKAAEQFWTGENPAVSVTGNRIALNNLHSQRALEQTVAIGQRDEATLGTRGIGIPWPGSTPCVAHVLPLANRNLPGLFRDDAVAAIFISRSGQELQPHMDAIAVLFGLTVAEQRVARQVANGLNRQAIAVANDVTDGTVKSQLDAIFDKTDTSNQRELAPPIDL
jgi:DNA-binding CsgD family transcriptional regulator